jgi:hypothetical protein
MYACILLNLFYCTKQCFKFRIKKENIPTSFARWKAELTPYGADDISKQTIFKICFKTTRDSSAQWLQFRILHRILPVGYYLEKKINVNTCNNCRLCKKKKEIETITHIFTSCDKLQTLWNDWLIDYLQFYVPLKNISLIWRRHHCRWRAAKFRPMLGAQGLWAGRDLYRATPAVTRDLGFSGLIRRTAPFSRLLRQTRGCGGSILTRILTGPLPSCIQKNFRKSWF